MSTVETRKIACCVKTNAIAF